MCVIFYFSYDRSNYLIFLFTARNFKNFRDIPDEFSDVSSSQHRRTVYTKCSGLLRCFILKFEPDNRLLFSQLCEKVEQVVNFCEPSIYFPLHTLKHRGGTVVKVLCPKSEGRCFDPRWCHFIDIKSFRSQYYTGVDSASNRNENQEHFREG